MSEPIIPAEKSPAVAVNGPDDQTSLALWLDHDPNRPRQGIYEFAIEADELKQVLQAVLLPKRRAPFFTIELSNAALKVIATTADASFVIATTAPLFQHAAIGAAPIRFEVDRDVTVMVTFISTITGPLAFTFDRLSSSLAWEAGDEWCRRCYCTTARWVPTPVPETGLRSLAVMSPSAGRGIRYAATLINRKEPPNFPYDGVLVEGGSILGGYFCGLSRWRSPLLPENLILSVPKAHVANAVALCRRSAGEIEVSETDARIYFKAVNIEGSWPRIQQQSAGPLNSIFEAPPLQTVMVSTAHLLNDIYCMAELFEEFQMTIEERETHTRVVFTGSSGTGRGIVGGRTVLQGCSERTGVGRPRPWDTINAKDLRDAVSAIYHSSATTFLSVIKQGLLIRSEADEAEYATILLGHERQ